MTLFDAIKEIAVSAEKMNALYKDIVFDELILVCLRNGRESILHYFGPRKDTYSRRFDDDLKKLKEELRSGKNERGDFSFARDGTGPLFDAFVSLGDDVYLICNCTSKNMEEITRNPLWLSAQIPFVELCEKFKASKLKGIE